jgi:hypothetical protein
MGQEHEKDASHNVRASLIYGVQRYDRLEPMTPCSTSHARVGLREDDGKRSKSEGLILSASQEVE